MDGLLLLLKALMFVIRFSRPREQMLDQRKQKTKRKKELKEKKQLQQRL
jgi:hypothetical protein